MKPSSLSSSLGFFLIITTGALAPTTANGGAALATQSPGTHTERSLDTAPMDRSAQVAANSKHGDNMLKVPSQQMDQVAKAMFIEKMEAAFIRDVPGFSDLDKAERSDFIQQSMAGADQLGLKTEQGIVSYALGVWWLGLHFETASDQLKTLLQSDYPEVRKVHAMNEWVQAALGAPDNLGAADEKLTEALKLTEPWGK